jgi:hypothetical protein
MNKTKISPFVRPTVGAAGFLLFFCIYIAAKGRELTLAKAGVVASWLLISVVILAGVQIGRKKELGWIVSVVGVIAVAMLVGAIMLSVKNGQFVTR